MVCPQRQLAEAVAQPAEGEKVAMYTRPLDLEALLAEAVAA